MAIKLKTYGGMSSRPYKLELKMDIEGRADPEIVSFGPRRQGDQGRDILIVREALGSITTIGAQGDSSNETELEDPNGWLDCMTGKEITPAQAAAFDESMATHLIKYQLDNQFFILSYLFTKFAVPEMIANIRFAKEDSTVSSIDDDLNDAQNEFNIQKINTELAQRQIETITALFEAELGNLKEATLAVMHGWLPRTVVGETTYYHDVNNIPRLRQDGKAYDLVLRTLHEMFAHGGGLLGQTLDSPNSEEVIVGAGPNGRYNRTNSSDPYEEAYKPYLAGGIEFGRAKASYKQTVSSMEDALPSQAVADLSSLNYTDRAFASISYKLRDKSDKSILYSAFEKVTEILPRTLGTGTYSNTDYANAAQRAQEPDHLINPDPFIIDSETLGYFWQTEYTLENLPPEKPKRSDFASNAEYREKLLQYNLQIFEIEKKALYDLLDFFNKPVVFVLDPKDLEYQRNFTSEGVDFLPLTDSMGSNFSSSGEVVLHKPERVDNASLNGKWVLTPKVSLAESILSSNPNYRQATMEYHDYAYNVTGNQIIKLTSGKPLIKFSEFRFPSLRPGDFYRAKFTIDVEKIKYITDGLTVFDTGNQQASLATAKEEAESRVSNSVINSCNEDGTPISADQQKRRYQEFKALAAKRKREVQRALREKLTEYEAVEGEMGTSTTIDLGVLGNAEVNLLGATTPKFTGDFTDAVLKNSLSAFNMLGSDNDIGFYGPSSLALALAPGVNGGPDKITMTFGEMYERSQTVSKDIKEAYKLCIQEGVTFTGRPDFNGDLEASHLESAIAEIKYLVEKYAQVSLDFSTDYSTGLEGIPAVGTVFRLNDGRLQNRPGEITIKFKFTNSGNNGEIQEISLNSPASSRGGGKQVIFSTKTAAYSSLKAQAPNLTRDLTLAYLSQLYQMSGGALQTSWLSNPFDFSKSPLCSDYNIGKKGLAWLKRYTPSMKGKIKEFEPAVEISKWARQNAINPAQEYASRNARMLVDAPEVVYGQDELLKRLGKSCSIPKLFGEYLDRLSLGALLCDIIKCIKLPPFSLKIPDFTLPDIPDLSIFRWWYAMWKSFVLNFSRLLGRFLCTFVRTILEFLRFPWCKESLRNQLFGEAAGSNNVAQAALADALTDLQLSEQSMNIAPEFVEKAATVMTNSEFCRLLQGEFLDDAAMQMLMTIAQASGMSELNTPAEIVRFYDHLGTFMPEDFCEQLTGIDWMTVATDCETTSDAVADLRRQLLANEHDPETIDRVLEEYNKQLFDHAQALELLTEQGMNAVMPNLVDFSDPGAVINKLPDTLMRQTVKSLKSVFEPARSSYISSLSKYGNNYFLNSTKIAGPGDDNYDEEAAIKCETILENFRKLSELQTSSSSEFDIMSQIAALYTTYEVEQVGDTDSRVLKLYEVPKDENGNLKKLFSQDMQKTGDSAPVAVPHSKRGEYLSTEGAPEIEIAPRPIGFLYSGFYFTDESGRPEINRNARFPQITVSEREREGETEEVIQDQRSTRFFKDTISSKDKFYEKMKNPDGSAFWFVAQHQMLAQAEEETDENGLPVLDPGSSKQFLISVLQDRIRELQSELESSLTNIARPQPTEEYLALIRDILDFSKENSLEDNARSNNTPSGESVSIETDTSKNSITMTVDFGSLIGSAEKAAVDLPVMKYTEYKWRPQSDNSINILNRISDPYTITLYNDNLFFNNLQAPNPTRTTSASPASFRFCDTFLGPEPPVNKAYSNTDTDAEIERAALSDDVSNTDVNYIRPASDNLGPFYDEVSGIISGEYTEGLYTRREIFARKHLNFFKQMMSQYNDYTNTQNDDLKERESIEAAGEDAGSIYSKLDTLIAEGPDQREASAKSELYDDVYSSAIEGMFEQIFFSLKRSRLFDDPDYHEGLQRRVAAQTYREEETGCYRNRYNLSQLGVLSFEKIITDILEEEIQAEMAKPENSYQNMDYDDIGPIEKAIKNVCLIGFIRISLIELLLKGSFAYSVWDLEGVYSEPLIKDFFYRFVHSELNSTVGFKPTADKMGWKETIENITGISNSQAALKKVVDQQAMKLMELSKTLYENPRDVDYYNWYMDHFIPQSEVSRTAIVYDYELGGRVTLQEYFSDPNVRRSDRLKVESKVVSINNYIDQQGNRVEPTEQPLLREVPKHFYWQHPLHNAATINLVGNRTSQRSVRGANEERREISDRFMEGNDHFFHIEHGLRITGPLAAIETLVLPSKEIIEKVESSSSEFSTFVEDRDIQTLSLKESLSRLNFLFGGLPNMSPSIDEYSFKVTPTLPGAAAGSSVEAYNPEGSLAERQEIFNIDDFISAVKGALNADHLEKYIYHLQGLIHYDENPAEAPGGEKWNTDLASGEGFPLSVRRTPSRFIIKKREIIKFKKDFLSHRQNAFAEDNMFSYSEDEGAFRSVSDFHKFLYDPEQLSIGVDNAHSLINLMETDTNILVDDSQFQDIEYYVIATDGLDVKRIIESLEDESLIDFSEAQQRKKNAFRLKSDIFNNENIYNQLKSEMNLNAGKSSSKLNIDLKLEDTSNVYYTSLDYIGQTFNIIGESGDTIFGSLTFEGGGGFDVSDHIRDIQERAISSNNGIINNFGLPYEANISYSSDSPKFIGSGITTEINVTDRVQERDLLYNRPNLAGGDVAIWSNLIGQLANENDFNQAREAAMSSQESYGNSLRDETWIETVYDFSGDASILVGLQGSFNIGETFDPAILYFEPNTDCIQEFENLKKTMDDFYGEVAYENMVLKGYHAGNLDQDGEDTRVSVMRGDVSHAADYKSTSIGRTFFIIRDGTIDKPYLGRPMGIENYSNLCSWGHLVGPVLDIKEDNYSAKSTVDNPYCMYPFPNANNVYGPGAWEEHFGSTLESGNTFYNLSKSEHSGLRRNCSLLHFRPTLEKVGTTNIRIEANSKTELLPPNMYRIPMRILVTRVYIANNPRPSEVYCRVVLPEYLENYKKINSAETPHNVKVQKNQENIEKLNKSMIDTVRSYREFVDEAKQIMDDTDSGIAGVTNFQKIRAISNAVVPKINDAQGFYEGDENLTYFMFPHLSADIDLNYDRSIDPQPQVFNRKYSDELVYGNASKKFAIDSALECSTYYTSIERIYSHAFEIDASSADYNTTDELDDLFLENRGELMMKPTSIYRSFFFDRAKKLNSGRNRTKFSRADLENFMRTFNYFYDMDRDFNAPASILLDSVTPNGSSAKSLFLTISNILSNFLTSRSRNSLWSATTATASDLLLDTRTQEQRLLIGPVNQNKDLILSKTSELEKINNINESLDPANNQLIENRVYAQSLQTAPIGLSLALMSTPGIYLHRRQEEIARGETVHRSSQVGSIGSELDGARPTWSYSTNRAIMTSDFRRAAITSVNRASGTAQTVINYRKRYSESWKQSMSMKLAPGVNTIIIDPDRYAFRVFGFTDIEDWIEIPKSENNDGAGTVMGLHRPGIYSNFHNYSPTNWQSGIINPNDRQGSRIISPTLPGQLALFNTGDWRGWYSRSLFEKHRNKIETYFNLFSEGSSIPRWASASQSGGYFLNQFGYDEGAVVNDGVVAELVEREGRVKAGLLNDGNGWYAVNYNRIPSLRLTSRKSSLYVSNGELSLDEITAYIRAVITEAHYEITSTSYEDQTIPDRPSERRNIWKIDKIYQASNFYKNVNNFISLSNIVNNPYSSNMALNSIKHEDNSEFFRDGRWRDLSDSVTKVNFEKFIIPEEVYGSSDYEKFIENTNKTRSEKKSIVNKAFRKIHQFVENLCLLSSRRSMYSVRSECDMIRGETLFSNPTAPFWLKNLLIILKNVERSFNNADEKLAALACIAKYDMPRRLMISLNSDTTYSFMSELGNELVAEALYKTKKDIAIMCLYYLHFVFSLYPEWAEDRQANDNRGDAVGNNIGNWSRVSRLIAGDVRDALDDEEYRFNTAASSTGRRTGDSTFRGRRMDGGEFEPDDSFYDGEEGRRETTTVRYTAGNLPAANFKYFRLVTNIDEHSENFDHDERQAYAAAYVRRRLGEQDSVPEEINLPIWGALADMKRKAESGTGSNYNYTSLPLMAGSGAYRTVFRMGGMGYKGSPNPVGDLYRRDARAETSFKLYPVNYGELAKFLPYSSDGRLFTKQEIERSNKPRRTQLLQLKFLEIFEDIDDFISSCTSAHNEFIGLGDDRSNQLRAAVDQTEGLPGISNALKNQDYSRWNQGSDYVFPDWAPEQGSGGTNYLVESSEMSTIEQWQRDYRVSSSGTSLEESSEAMRRKLSEASQKLSEDIIHHSALVRGMYYDQSRADQGLELEGTIVERAQPELILQSLDYMLYEYITRNKAESALDEVMGLQELSQEQGDSGFASGLSDKLSVQKSNLTSYETYVELSRKASMLTMNMGADYNPRTSAILSSMPEVENSAQIMKTGYLAAMERHTGIESGLDYAIFSSALSGVTDGLLASSTVEQICRLVSNIPINTNSRRDEAGELSKLVRTIGFTKPSEELRSGLMVSAKGRPSFLSVPIAEQSYMISYPPRSRPDSPRDEIMVNCWNMNVLKEKYDMAKGNLTRNLIDSQEARSMLSYIIPTRRFQALATIYSSTALSMYSGMPSLLKAPKRSLGLLSEINSLNAKQRSEFMENVSHGDMLKQFLENPVSDPSELNCFTLFEGFGEELLEQFIDMLVDLIKYFPSSLLRGIANTIDPAYKEMKNHWDGCNIKELNMTKVDFFTAEQPEIIAGRTTTADGDGKYSMILPTGPIDLVYGAGKLLVFDTEPFKRSIKRTLGYVYKGPIALINEGMFGFQMPCVDVDISFPDEGASWNFDRYGHPMSPITALALSTLQLPGDKRRRQQSGVCDDAPVHATPPDPNDFCNDDRENPLGGRMTPEDFE